MRRRDKKSRLEIRKLLSLGALAEALAWEGGRFLFWHVAPRDLFAWLEKHLLLFVANGKKICYS